MIITIQTTPVKENEENRSVFKILNQKLLEKAAELQHFSLRHLEYVDPIFEDVVIYLVYNAKTQMRWYIANDVSSEINTLILKEMTKLDLQVLDS
ncbi:MULTISPECIES: hypothetical protein [unclassified Pedobacter]|uniref:hypothetical protein n=1 Tax=unclassified Pedobacter TaxID=2628915 RepID=UPI000D36AA39|nr:MULTISPECIES: hypothetical protein [unclassified Pedobacter]PTS96828.1 hypothetical protein DBR11_18470 [Pedobacter sp. HMWF019]HWW41227.1 hypothetical protein [Pedobacter sp.]